MRLTGHIHLVDVLHLRHTGQTQLYSLVDYRTHRTQGRPDNPNLPFYFQRFVIIIARIDVHPIEVGSSEYQDTHEKVAELRGINMKELLVDAYYADVIHSAIGAFKGEVIGTP